MEAKGIEKVYNYLNDAQTYYLATVDDGKPRVRPFGTILLDDGKLYIQTGKVKDVSKQIAACPYAEICACMGPTWLRIQAELVEDDNREVKVKMLDKLPSLKVSGYSMKTVTFMMNGGHHFSVKMTGKDIEKRARVRYNDMRLSCSSALRQRWIHKVFFGGYKQI